MNSYMNGASSNGTIYLAFEYSFVNKLLQICNSYSMVYVRFLSVFFQYLIHDLFFLVLCAVYLQC